MEHTNEEDINPFHHTRSHYSCDDSIPSPWWNLNYHRNFNIKVNILEFEGRIQLDEFLEWLHTIERVFYYKDVLDKLQVSLLL